MSGYPILVVDDDDVVSRTIRSALERVGYLAETSGSVSHALEILQDRRPSLLITDLELPDGDGWQVIQEARRLHTQPELPAVVISSLQVRRSILREYQVHRFISKPFDMTFLIEVVTEIISTRTPRSR